MALKQKTAPAKKYFTAAEANAMLPLVRAIVRDIAALARDLRERHERLARIKKPDFGKHVGGAHDEELQQAEAVMEEGQARMQEYEAELKRLGIELKDYYTGLIDFPARMDGREVYLCWRLGEAEVGHWHELDSGFAGRQRLAGGAAATR